MVTCMSVHQMNVWCPWKSEVVDESPGTEFTSCVSQVLEIKARSSARTSVLNQ